MPGMAFVIYLVHESPRGSSVLPSTVLLGRATLRRWYTWTCSPQSAQPNDHPLAGGLLHHLLTLTSCEAVIFFCRHLLSPIASTFGSGAPCAARTFLSRDLSEAPATNRSSAFSGCKGKDIFAKTSKIRQKLPKIISIIAYLQLKAQ